MPKKRASLKHTEVNEALERSFERKARDFAFESGIIIDLQDTKVFIKQDEKNELLCTIDDRNHFWREVWRSMCEQFPALSRYVY